MNKRLLFVALIFAILTGISIISYMKGLEKKKLKGFEMEAVVVAAQDIPARSVITEDMVEIKKVPKVFVQPGAFKSVEDVAGKVALVPIKAGTQIQADFVVEMAQMRGLSAIIPAGYRTVTISVSLLTGAAGLIIPGDVVDLYAVIEPQLVEQYFPGFLKKPVAVVPYENVLVLAVGQKLPTPTVAATTKESLLKEMASTATGASTLTLAVAPDTAQELLLLQRIATIYAIPKPIGDRTYIPLKPLTTYQILKKYLRLKPRKRRRYDYIEIYAGGQEGISRELYKISGDEVYLVSQSITAPRGGGLGFPQQIQKTKINIQDLMPGLPQNPQQAAQKIRSLLDKLTCPGGNCVR